MKFILIFISLFITFNTFAKDDETSESNTIEEKEIQKNTNIEKIKETANKAKEEQISTPPPQKGSMMDHSHIPIDLPENTPFPALSISLNQDAMSGYNLILTLERYQLMPPPAGVLSMADLMSATVNKESGFAEGHAHLYVNGNKIQRIYSENVHIPQEHFKSGINTVSITLNNHGHMYWVADKKKILATIYLDQAKTPFITYQFESFPAK